jgi:transposase InsO family protein
MPWKVETMSDVRMAFVHNVVTLKRSVSAACRDFGISRQTGHLWLQRYHAQPEEPLVDHSRRPHSSPARTASAIERAVLEVRDRFGWGPRKIRAYLLARGVNVPSARTLAAILRRQGRVPLPPATPPPLQRFERAAPNELWQCDFKGPLEVERRRIHPFTILDDHSRFLLALRPCLDQTMNTAWNVLWEAFEAFGLPEAVLCDNAFGTRITRTPGVSWFEARLLRLGIRCLHGRPYHPQTQGKIERLHGTLEREVWPGVRRDALCHFAADIERWRVHVYNSIRPHEALADRPPIARWRPGVRRRPATLPELTYPPGSLLRKVSSVGDVRWRTYRILAGRGIVGDYVRIEEREQEVVLFYAQQPIRSLRLTELTRDTML